MHNEFLQICLCFIAKILFMELISLEKLVVSIVICSFVIFGISCNDNPKVQEDAKFIIVDTVTYETGFNPNTHKQYIEYNETEYVAFANTDSYCKISVFTVDGDFQFSVPLNSLMRQENNYFHSFCFMESLDSLALLSYYTNKIVIIDRNGKTLHRKDYSDYISDSAFLFPDVKYSNNSFRTAVRYSYSHFPKNPTIEDYENYNYISHCYYTMMYDTAYYQQIIPELQMDSIYCRNFDKTEYCEEWIHILMLDSLNIFYSNRIDSLYVFDMHSNLLKTVQIKSKYTDIKYIPTSIKQFVEGVENESYKKYGAVVDLHWDKYRCVYYCFVRAAKEGDIFPFSVIILDEEFNNIGEIKFNAIKYNLMGSFVGRKGLYVLNRSEDSHLRQTYTVFSYE